MYTGRYHGYQVLRHSIGVSAWPQDWGVFHCDNGAAPLQKELDKTLVMHVTRTSSIIADLLRFFTFYVNNLTL